MRVVIFEFKQETNSFSPVACGLQMFRDTYLIEDAAEFGKAERFDTELYGMIDELKKVGAEVIFSFAARSVSSGPVERTVVDLAIKRLTRVIAESGKVDGIFMSLHGGTQLTDEDDGIGLILAETRKIAGEDVVIAASSDYHANITEQVVKAADIMCGFQTYPHVDMFETGRRAARLGIDLILGRRKACMAFVKLPMIHQAEACLNTEGPMRELFDHARDLAKEEGIHDFSIYQMQPWMNVAHAGASVLVIADSGEKALACADRIATRYWDIRGDLKYDLYDLDEVLDIALKTQGKPVVISDSADSPSAGSPGDSTFVLKRLLERGIDLETYLSLMDPVVPNEAQRVGAGNKAKFRLGGKIDKKRSKSLEVEAYVKAISDGDYIAIDAYKGKPVHMGLSALLKIGNIHVMVTAKSVANFDTGSYRSFGLHPENARIIMVKSAIQYRAVYSQMTDQMYTVDTPGASSANLFSFDFDKIPRPMYPFEYMDAYQPSARMLGHQRSKHAETGR
jgi:microcystin degradation protein MlrC